MTATDELDRDGDARIAAFLDRGAARPSVAALPDLALVRARGRRLRTRRRVGAVAAGTALCLAVSGGIVAERVVLTGPPPEPAHLSPLVTDAPCTASDRRLATGRYASYFMQQLNTLDLPRHTAVPPTRTPEAPSVVVPPEASGHIGVVKAGPLPDYPPPPFTYTWHAAGGRWVTDPGGLHLAHTAFGATGDPWTSTRSGGFTLDEADFGSPQTARDVVALLTQRMRCALHADVRASTDTQVTLVEVHAPNEPRDLNVLRLVGRTVIDLRISLAADPTGVLSTPPNVLKGLLDLAADRAEGRTGKPVTLTYGEPIVVSTPRGFLQVADLGPDGGWSVTPGDESSDSSAHVALPVCGSVPATGVVGSKVQQLYRGTGAQGGSGELILNEQVTALDAHEVGLARQALTAARSCHGAFGQSSGGLAAGHPLLGSSGDPVTVVVGTTANGQPSTATTWTLTGHSLIVIDTLPGGAAGGAPQPGGPSWLLATAHTAVERATAAGR